MIKKLFSVLIAMVLLLITAAPAFAENINITNVTFVCKVNGIETDDYSPVVVKIMNEETYDTYEFRLYKYNSFSERYEVPNGTYTIVWARVDNRNDIIFNVISEDHFDIGRTKTIYFELNNSDFLITETTTTTTVTEISPTESTTEEKTLHTLYDLSAITKETTESDINHISSDKETYSDIALESSSYKETTTDAFSSVVANEKAEDGLKAIIISVSLISLLVAGLVTLVITNKKRGDNP